MAIHLLNPDRANLEGWRVAKKINSSQRGAIKLARIHGKSLLCVRYRESTDGTERLTTIELVIERTVIQKRDDPIVSFKIKAEETDLRSLAQSKGAKYDYKNFMWRMLRSEVIRMGLKGRIAVTDNDLLREQVHP